MTQKNHFAFAYIKIARPDHWFKNIFIIPGFLLACQTLEISPFDRIYPFFAGLLAACLIASANYVINEWLDRDFDRFHPVKKNRPSVASSVTRFGVFLTYGLLLLGGLGLSYTISNPFFILNFLFGCAGILYNVKPFRTKDRVFLDVLSESINNPIRLYLGWLMVSLDLPSFPPSSIMISYWMGGAFLMSVKRFSEFRFIGNSTQAGLYRASFKHYTNETLLASTLFYAMMSAFFAAVYIVKHRIELVLTLPFYSLLFAWYFHIGFKPNSAAQHPERMYQEKSFIVFTLIVFLSTLTCFYLKIPALSWLLK